MKIRTQLIAGTVIFALLLIIISGLIFSTNQQLDKLMAQEDLANRITLDVSELGYLSNDYILYREPLQADRWNAKFTSVSTDIAHLDLSASDQQAVAGSLATGLGNMRSVFDDISTSPLQTGAEREAFVELSWSRMAVQNQGMIFDANRLAHLLRDEESGLRGTRLIFIVALMGTFGAFLLTSYFLFYRRTLKSIAGLQEGARIIGAGNLGHVIEQRSDDEIGELSGTINRMTADLRTVIASKSELEREVTARKNAEERLRRANDELAERK